MDLKKRSKYHKRNFRIKFFRARNCLFNYVLNKASFPKLLSGLTTAGGSRVKLFGSRGFWSFKWFLEKLFLEKTFHLRV